MGCWICRLTILAIVVLIIALAWEAVVASTLIVELAAALSTSAEVLTGVLAGIFAWTAAEISDYLCCKFIGVCCPERG